ncbi:HD-GYP domain-containing protein [Thalassoroseus pseudoceratinae]|uniref:HD-GYP domain-containing protein n=1 Tax=Thalassoroseus pseudoceratinae TaxID=2713176 RepID=UPI00141F7132|nr:HD domain-containing phosphohydrolase [Thalassoroseus pseudoceratinae]
MIDTNDWVFPGISASELQNRVVSHRMRLSDDERNELANRYHILRRSFGRLSHRWTPLLEDPHCPVRHEPALNRLAKEAIGTSKVVYAELSRIKGAHDDCLPAHVLSSLLDWNSLQIGRLEAQTKLLTAAKTTMKTLGTQLALIASGRQESFAELASLSRSLLIDLRWRPQIESVLPDPDTELAKSYPDAEEHPTLSHAAAIGWETARVTAWMIHHGLVAEGRAVCGDLDAGLVVAAALLQDVGLIRLERKFRLSPEEIRAKHWEDYKQHPIYTVALSSQIADLPVELCRALGQHHERLDGTGYPRGPETGRMSVIAQFLAIVNRFRSLVHHVPDDVADIERFDPSWRYCAAAARLYDEAQRGWWNTELAKQIGELLDPELPSAVDRSLDTGMPVDLGVIARRRWKLHVPHRDLGKPHIEPATFPTQNDGGWRTTASAVPQQRSA